MNTFRLSEPHGCGCGCCCKEEGPVPVRAQEPAPVVPFMPKNPAFAMAYVPMEFLDKLYPPEEALLRGTAFPELDLPFGGMTIGGCRHG